ncbi:MAG: hypothetical protein AABY22_31145, partial [Nanoarchaeota archaeon]
MVNQEKIDQENTEITKSLKDTLNKKFGQEVAFLLDQDENPATIKNWLSTGSTVLDSIISNNPEFPGGIATGKLVEVSGLQASGKSLLAYMVMKDCKERGGIPVLIDTEYAANINFLQMLGLEPKKNFIYIQVDSIEDVFESIEEIIKKIRESSKNKLCTIVWDSVAGTSTKKELQNDYDEVTMASHARVIGQGLRKVIRYVGNQNVALVFLNQLRMKMNAPAFSDPYSTFGGMAIPFFSSSRIRLSIMGKIKDKNGVICGINTKCKIEKNRFGPPYRECILNI